MEKEIKVILTVEGEQVEVMNGAKILRHKMSQDENTMKFEIVLEKPAKEVA